MTGKFSFFPCVRMVFPFFFRWECSVRWQSGVGCVVGEERGVVTLL